MVKHYGKHMRAEVYQELAELLPSRSSGRKSGDARHRNRTGDLQNGGAPGLIASNWMKRSVTRSWNWEAICALSTLSSAGCDSVPLFENELLYTPVQQLAHIELIVRRTCNFVNPSELLELFARFP